MAAKHSELMVDKDRRNSAAFTRVKGLAILLALQSLFLGQLGNCQSSQSYSAVSEEEVDQSGKDGLGMAEIIAITVCGLIIFAFLLACYVMIRNAQKRRKMSE